MHDHTTFKTGQLVKVTATGKTVEILDGPSGAKPGLVHFDTSQGSYQPSAWALDLETRQISVYLLEDLQMPS